jgi:uncharacterized protein YdhG (YjbR/CyaY superfamily)
MAKTKTPDREGEATKFTAEEKAAMRERAKELKAQQAGVDGEQEIQAKIAELPSPDREMAERIHALVKATAPSLTPRTYYGMPAWAKDGKVLCFFQPASKFKYRYSTFGFNEDAKLDEGAMWPTAWALTSFGKSEEDRLRELLKKAVG